ncbi:LGFP repeat-containing protein [Corynebacterium sp. LaCa116]|uniref:LGFP repeat-containing protein n=1 Tax=Corynebacterium sp. LaCa116 TaxID=3391423 RepID=UPI003988D084
MKKMTRRFAAGIAAATLSLGVVACSDAEDAAKDAGDAAKSAATEATDAAGSAANDAKDSMKSSDSAEASNSEDADASEGVDSSEAEGAENSEGADSSESADAEGDMVGVSTADGEVEVSSDFADAIKEKAGEWGDPQSIETSADGDVATFAKDKLMTYSKDAGAQPIIGKIAETWTEDGGLQNKVGLPTGPEQESGDGWVQEFTNGTISWMKGESGKYEATVK